MLGLEHSQLEFHLSLSFHPVSRPFPPSRGLRTLQGQSVLQCPAGVGVFAEVA